MMDDQSAIFIFTKDRPKTLIKTLDSIRTIPYQKYVIDDSVTLLNQHAVHKLCHNNRDFIYLGKQEYKQFTSNHNIQSPKFDFLLREVGNPDWNLGYTRNFALLYAKSMGYRKVLFTDDDIDVPNPKLIGELFQSITKYKFAGANILGLVDDSVLGHIATDMGIINERILSGGFMVFNPNEINHFFLNNYNEDWIWLFLQLQNKNYLQIGEVFQELTDPLINYETKVMFQEFGEIVLDGILDLYELGSYNELTKLSFWERMVKERDEYLDQLLSKAISEDKERNKEIIEYIKINSTFEAKKFQKLFEKYFYNRKLFQEIFNSLS